MTSPAIRNKLFLRSPSEVKPNFWSVNGDYVLQDRGTGQRIGDNDPSGDFFNEPVRICVCNSLLLSRLTPIDRGLGVSLLQHSDHVEFAFQLQAQRLAGSSLGRSMLLTQPPVTKVQPTIITRSRLPATEQQYGRERWYEKATAKPSITNLDGVTAGDVLDALRLDLGQTRSEDVQIELLFRKDFVVTPEEMQLVDNLGTLEQSQDPWRVVHTDKHFFHTEIRMTSKR